MSLTRILDKGKPFSTIKTNEELKRKNINYAPILAGIIAFLLLSSIYTLAWNAAVNQNASPIGMTSVAEPKKSDANGQEIGIGDSVSVHVTRGSSTHSDWKIIHVFAFITFALTSMIVAIMVNKVKRR